MVETIGNDLVEDILGIPASFELFDKSLYVRGFYSCKKEFINIAEDPNVIMVELEDEETGIEFEMPLEMIEQGLK